MYKTIYFSGQLKYKFRGQKAKKMNSLRFVTKRQLHHRITNLCRRQSTFSGENSAIFDISAEVEAALNENRGVVALESTVITHGLQHPTNFE